MIAKQTTNFSVDATDYSEIKLGLERMSMLMERLGNPERSFRTIHIAGTNGKGSTAAFISTVLHEVGYRTGLYTSPHLERFSERIKIDGNEIAQTDIDRLSGEVKLAAEICQPLEPTYFEFTTAMAFLYFAQRKIDVAVVETGLGGRLDATNVITPLVSVITPIAMDHSEYLGNTPEEVAGEKGGIIKPGVPVVLGRQEEGVSRVIEDIARKKRARLYAYGRDFEKDNSVRNNFNYCGISGNLDNVSCSLYGDHQKENAAIAMATLEVVRKDGLQADEDAIRRGIKNSFLPGRFEIISENPEIILDGAHNPAGAQILAGTLMDYFDGEKGIFIAGFMGDKDVGGILKELSPLASDIILARPKQERAFDPREKMGYIKGVTGGCNLKIIPDIASAIDEGIELAGESSYLCVTGSFYTVGEARITLRGLI